MQKAHATLTHLAFLFLFLAHLVSSFQVDSGDRLSLELLPPDQGGRLKLSLAVAPNTGYTSDVAFDLADNRWHNVDVRFSADGFFQLQLDNEVVSIANASDINDSPLFRPGSTSSSITIGQGYTGCLLEGPSVRLSPSGDDDELDSRAFLLGQCPIPLSGNCSEYSSMFLSLHSTVAGRGPGWRS